MIRCILNKYWLPKVLIFPNWLLSGKVSRPFCTQVLTGKTSFKKTTWKDLNRSHGDQYPNLLSLIDLVLTIPASTAECERGFSAMKRVKSDWRCRLNTTTLSDLMFVMLEGSSIDMFNPSRACELWAEAAQRRPDYERSKTATKKQVQPQGHPVMSIHLLKRTRKKHLTWCI